MPPWPARSSSPAKSRATAPQRRPQPTWLRALSYHRRGADQLRTGRAWGTMTAAEPLELDIRANALRLHYLDWGGAGPPIVLLHGLRDQAHEWDPIAPALTPLGRVLA